MLGLPYAFASHFAPADLLPALEVYRSNFEPSKYLETPYAMAGVNAFVADTGEEARRLATTAEQAFANLHRGRPGPYPPPVDDLDAVLSPAERAAAQRMLTYSMIGTPESVRADLDRFVETTRVDEVMVVSAVYDHAARVRSYELLAEATQLSATAR
jgi:luciferase family oxidoreductase group 1